MRCDICANEIAFSKNPEIRTTYSGHCVIPDRYKDRGWLFEFRGWLDYPDRDGSVGQFLCATMDQVPVRTFYASYPGGEGEFQKGDYFDIDIRDGQTPPAWMEHRGPDRSPFRNGIKDAFDRLIGVLDKEFGHETEKEKELQEA